MYEEDFVTIETADLLSQAGYPQADAGFGRYYGIETGKCQSEDGRPAKRGYPIYRYVAKPTIGQAMKWLRNYAGVFVEINMNENKTYSIKLMNIRSNVCVLIPVMDGGECRRYEQAADNGISLVCEAIIRGKSSNQANTQIFR